MNDTERLALLLADYSRAVTRVFELESLLAKLVAARGAPGCEPPFVQALWHEAEAVLSAAAAEEAAIERIATCANPR